MKPPRNSKEIAKSKGTATDGTSLRLPVMTEQALQVYTTERGRSQLLHKADGKGVRSWFNRVFKLNLTPFMVTKCSDKVGLLEFDLLLFENHLESLGMKEDESMHGFMVRTFGEENTQLFSLIFL